MPVQIPGMFEDYPEMLRNSPNLYNQEIATWLDNLSEMQQAAIANAATRQQAASSQSGLLNNSEFMANLAALGQGMPAAPAQQEDPGFWSQVWNRAIDPVQGSLYGMVGLFGDLIGNETIRDWGVEGYQRNLQEAEEGAKIAPRQVPTIEDIHGLGDAGTWFMETLADQVPNLAATIGSAGIGALAGRAAMGALGRTFAQKFANQEMKNMAANAMAAGVAKEAAEKAAMAQIPLTLGSRWGANVGLYGSLGGIEAGSAYGEDVQRHGIEGTSPWMDLGVGAINAGIERAMGMEGSILRNVVGHPVKQATEKAARGILARGLWNITKSATKEGAAEVLQETTQMLNEKIQDDELGSFTPEDTSRLLNAFAAGAALGAPMGPFDAMAAKKRGTYNEDINKYKEQVFNPLYDEANKIPTDISAQGPADVNAVNTPLQELVNQAKTTQEFFTQAEDAVNAKYNNTLGWMQKDYDGIQSNIAALQATPAQDMGLTDEQKTARIKEAQKLLTQRAAQLTAIKDKQKSELQKLRSQQENQNNKLAKNVLNTAEQFQQQSITKNPIEYQELMNIRQDTSVYAQRASERIRKSLDITNERQLTLQNMLKSSRFNRLTPKHVQDIRKELQALRRNQLQLTSALRKISNTSSRLLNKTSDPRKLYTSLADAKADFETLRNAGNIEDVTSVASSVNAPLVDNLAKQQEEAQQQIIKNAERQQKELERQRKEVERQRKQDELKRKAEERKKTIAKKEKKAASQAKGVWPGEETRITQSNFANLPTVAGAFDAATAVDANAGIQPNASPYKTQTKAKRGKKIKSSASLADLVNPVQDVPQNATEMASTATKQENMGITPSRRVLSREELINRFKQQKAPQAVEITPVNKTTWDSVSKAVSSITKSYKGLQGKIDTVWAPSAEHANDLGFIDTNNHITLVASNIEKYAAKTGKSIQDITKQVIKHEGLGHYGLRTVLDSRGLSKFLDDVYSNFSGTQVWKFLEESQEDFSNLSPRQQAEEFCAALAEQVEASPKSPSIIKSAWTKLKSLVKPLLDGLDISSINKPFTLDKKDGRLTQQDIIEVLKAGANKLYSEDTVATSAPEQAMSKRMPVNQVSIMTRTEQALENENKSLLEKGIDALTDPELRKDFVEGFIERFVDATRAIQQMIRKIKQQGGKVDVDTNMFKIMQALPNITAVHLNQFKKQYVDPVTKAIANVGNPNDSAEIRVAKATDFLEAMAGLERNQVREQQKSYKKGEPPLSGKSNKYWQKIIDKYDSPEMRELMDEIQKLNNARLDLMEEYNLLPKEILDNWRSKYKYYMPFKSFENLIQEAAPEWYKGDTRKNLSTPNIQRKLNVQAGGREGDAQNPIAHAIMQAYDVVYLADKVNAGRALLQLVDNNPQATDVFEKVIFREPGKQALKDWPGLKRVVDKKDGTIKFVKTKSTAEGMMKDTLAVLDKDGNIQRILFKDKRALAALKGENIIQTPPAIRWIGSLQHTLGKYITSRNPLFWLRNPLRDAITAAINIQSLSEELASMGVLDSKEIATNIVKKGLFSVFNKNSVRGALFHYYRTGDTDFNNFNDETKEYMKRFKSFINYGGQTEYFGTNTYEAIKKDLASAVATHDPHNKKEKTKQMINKVGEYMDNISDSLENMTRFIVFEEFVRSVERNAQEVSDGVYRRPDGGIITEHEIMSRAANAALNITVNFSRKGSWAPIFNSLYMFASASIGGNVRMLETIFAKDPKTGKASMKNLIRFSAYPLFAYFTQQAIARALMPDDDDGINKYDKIPDYVKESNIILPSPTMDGSYITLPLPYGFNIFWTMARGIIDSAYSAVNGTPGPSFTKAVSGTLSSAFDNFASIGQTSEGLNMFVPSVFRPVYQLAMNKNFAGNPIMPEGNSYARGEVPDSQKYWSTTNETVKSLCKWFNEATFGNEVKSGIIDVSPESLEHLANSYLGGLGRMFFGMLGRVDDMVRGKGWDIGKTPGANIFYRTSQDSDTSAIFSKLRTEAMNQINAVDNARKSQELSAQDKLLIMQENSQGYRLKGLLNRIQTNLNKVRQQERLIDRSNLSVSEKTKRLEDLKKRKRDLMMQFNKAAIKAGIVEI